MKDSDGKNLLEHFYSDQVKYSFPFQMNSFISRVNSIYNAVVIDSGNAENPPHQERDALTFHEYDIVFVERSVFTDNIEQICVIRVERWELSIIFIIIGTRDAH